MKRLLSFVTLLLLGLHCAAGTLVNPHIVERPLGWLDSFDRADNGSSLGTATNFQTWTSDSWRIVSNGAQPPTSTGDFRASIASGIPGNAHYRIVFTSAGTNQRTSTGFITHWIDANNFWLTYIGNVTPWDNGGVLKVFERASGSWDGTPNDPGPGKVEISFGASASLVVDEYKLETGKAVFVNGGFGFYFPFSAGDVTTYLNAAGIGLRADVGASTDDGTSHFGQITVRPMTDWPGHTGPPIPVIIDTDCSADVGDANAIAGACVLHRLGVIEIVAITVCTSNTKAPGAVAALLKYYGVTGVEIGTWKGAAFDPEAGTWAAAIYDNFPRDPDGVTVGLASTVADADDVLAAALTARTSRDIRLVALGPLNNISAILASQPTLCATKVLDLVVMGGKYPTNAGTAEWNLEKDPVAAADVAANWPTKILWQGYEVGVSFNVGTNHDLKDSSNPLYVAFDDAGALAGGRQAWDDMTIFPVFMPGEFLEVRGSNSVNSSTGKNTFTPSSSGKDAYIIKAKRDSRYAGLIETLVDYTGGALPSFP